MDSDSKIDSRCAKIICALQSKSDTFSALLKIRSDNGSSRFVRKFRERGGVQILVGFLSQPNANAIDITLSILANWCLMDESIRAEVAEVGVIRTLVLVLRNIDKASIQGRTCRLIANLSLTRNVAVKFHGEEAVNAIVDVVHRRGKNFENVNMDAVRALRILWEVEEERENMLKLGAVRAVTLLLELQLSGSCEILMGRVLKTLVAFTTNCSELCATQIHADGSGFKWLTLCVDNPALKSMALHCLYNLCFIASSRPSLGNFGAVNIFVSNLDSPNTACHMRFLTALCLLCRESVNRAKVRCAGGLPVMLKVLRTATPEKPEFCVLQAFLHFIHDEESLKILIKYGFIIVLIEKLNSWIMCNKKEHVDETESTQCGDDDNDVDIFSLRKLKFTDMDKASNRQTVNPQRFKRFRASSPSYQAVIQEQGNSSSHSPDYYGGGDWSPGSSYSMCYSPACSSSSPRSCSPSSSCDPFNYPEAYSPICPEGSDEEALGDEEKVILQEKELDIVLEDDLEDLPSNKLPSDVKLSHHQAVSPVLFLLSRVSHMLEPATDLAAEKTVTTLIDYITLVTDPSTRASRILMRVVRNNHYFMALLQQKFVLNILHRLCNVPHVDCQRCKKLLSLGEALLVQLRLLAESGFGEGELSYQLKLGDQDTRRLLAVTVPHVIKALQLLRKLMLDRGGLDTLLDVLSASPGREDLVSQYAACSIAQLASSLGITSWPVDDPSCVGDTTIPKYEDSTSEDKLVFELDDGGVFSVNQDVLANKSPVFEAMFCGRYKESTLEKVPLPGITSICFKQLVQFLRGTSLCALEGIDLTSALQLMMALDRFLLPGSHALARFIIHKFLTPHTALSLYTSVMDLGNSEQLETLSIEALSLLLVADMVPQERREIFEDFMQSSRSERVLNDLKILLHCKLRHTQSV